MTTDKLLPCPFCGADPVLSDESLDERYAYANKVTIACKSCGCSMHEMGDASKHGYADNSTTKNRAVAKWQARAAQAPSVPTTKPTYLDLFKEAGDWSRTHGTKITPDMAELLGWLTASAQVWVEGLASTTPSAPTEQAPSVPSNLGALVARVEDAASAALTQAHNAGKVAHKAGIYMLAIESGAELAHAIIELREAILAAPSAPTKQAGQADQRIFPGGGLPGDHNGVIAAQAGQAQGEAVAIDLNAAWCGYARIEDGEYKLGGMRTIDALKGGATLPMFVFTNDQVEALHDLYTHPARQPLSEEQIAKVVASIDPGHDYLPAALRQFARAIEHAHGISPAGGEQIGLWGCDLEAQQAATGDGPGRCAHHCGDQGRCPKTRGPQ